MGLATKLRGEIAGGIAGGTAGGLGLGLGELRRSFLRSMVGVSGRL